jgi:phage tail-like protein
MALISDGSKLGLANRFEVIVDGKVPLGSWAKAEGLDVTWDVCDYRAGDQGNERYYYPGNTKYTPIRLTRAASKEDTPKVKAWLAENSFKYAPIMATIILKDSANEEVNKWDLRRVMPTKWSITSFDAHASAVATETLELMHNGFLDD